jgi:tetratricopeptide (TPR) repeat protein
LIFERLSVFAGRFSLESAEAVTATAGIEAGDVLDLVGRLADKSLVAVEPDADRRAFRLLETLREYGAERLAARGDLEDFRRRHAEHFTAQAEYAEALIGEDRPRALAKIDTDLDNLRTALGWAKEGHADLGLRLSVALIRFWAGRGYYAEGIEWLRLFADAPEASSTRRIKALNGIGQLAQELGDFASAAKAYSEGLKQARASDDSLSAAFAMNNLGTLTEAQGDYEAASRYFEESLGLLRTLGTVMQITTVLNNLGQLYFAQADFARAKPTQEECLALQRKDGDLQGIAISVGNLAQIVLISDGDLDDAGRLADECLRHSKELGDHLGVALSHQTFGDIARRRGNLEEASMSLGTSLSILRDQGLKPNIVGVLESFAAVAAARGSAELALRLAGAAAALREAINKPIAPVYKVELDVTLEAARSTLTKAAADRAWRQGREMPLDSAIEAAITAQ